MRQLLRFMYVYDIYLSERGFGHDSIIHVNTMSISDIVIYCLTLVSQETTVFLAQFVRVLLLFYFAAGFAMADNIKEDDELSIPRASLNKMIKELVPNVRVANDARELILNCCTEFIHLVSSEANDVCNKQQKKTITPDHIIEGTK